MKYFRIKSKSLETEKTVPVDKEVRMWRRNFRKLGKGFRRVLAFRPLNSPRRKLIAGSMLITVTGVLALGTNYVVIPLLDLKSDFGVITAEIDSLKQELGNKDISHFQQRTSQITTKLTNIDHTLGNYDFLGNVSFISEYYQNLQLGRSIIRKSAVLIDNNDDELVTILAAAGYSKEPIVTPVVESEQEIASVISQMPKLIALYEKAEPQIIDIMTDINKIKPAFIPKTEAIDITDNIAEVQSLTKDFPLLSQDLKAIFRVVPSLIGATERADYLILFQNPMGMRTSGGLLTAWGNMYIDKGELSDEISSKDMWVLNDDLNANRIHPPIYSKNGQLLLMTYNGRCGASITRPQDSGIYPDQHQTIKRFLEYYDRAANNRKLAAKYPAYDHVILLNVLFASDLIKYVEPIAMPEFNVVVDSKNMAWVLTDHLNTDAKMGSVNGEVRKDFIKVLATRVKDKITALDMDKLPEILIGFLQSVRSRNISFYSKNSDVQAFFDANGFSGHTPVPDDFSGDYFQHLEAQYCALKSNFFVRNQVTSEIGIGGDGTVTKKVNIKWRNEAYMEDTPHFIISNSATRYPYAVWSRLLVPSGSTFVSSDAKQKSSYFNYATRKYFDNEIRGQIYDNVILFRHRRVKGEPVKTQDYTTEYRLPDSKRFNPSTGYKLLLVKHAGKMDEEFKFNIYYNNQVYTHSLFLDKDTVLTWKPDTGFTTEVYDHSQDKLLNLTTQLQTMLAN